MQFKYAAGMPGYGTVGVDGSDGLLSLAIYFSEYDGVNESTSISAKITANKILSKSVNELLPGYPIRIYQNGDIFIDTNGKTFKITDADTGTFIYTDSRLNTSTIFVSGITTDDPPNYERYSNAFTTDKFLVDTVLKEAAGNYAASPGSGADSIYNIPAKNFAKINYVDISLNDYYPYEVFGNTTANEPEKAIALVKEYGRNTWRLGNLDNAGVIRDVSLYLDFADIYVQTIHGTISGSIETENLFLNGWLKVNSDTSIGGSLIVHVDASIHGNVEGINVTSGANPGHTHTGISISSLAASDITSGSFSVPRGGTGLTTIGEDYMLAGNGVNALVPYGKVKIQNGAVNPEVFINRGSTDTSAHLHLKQTSTGDARIFFNGPWAPSKWSVGFAREDSDINNRKFKIYQNDVFGEEDSSVSFMHNATAGTVGILKNSPAYSVHLGGTSFGAKLTSSTQTNVAFYNTSNDELTYATITDGDGMYWGTFNGTVDMGTPSDISTNSTNLAGGTTHSHNLNIPAKEFSSTEVTNLRAAKLDDGTTPWYNKPPETVNWASGLYGNNNFLITAIGDGSIITESNLTFDGADLTINGYIKAGNATGIQFKENGGSENWRMSDNGDFHAEGNVVAYSATVSDVSLKTNIKPLELSLNKIIALNGIEYDRKRNKDHHIGFIAQEVEKIIPEIVHETELLGEKGIFKTIRYTELIPYLVESIKTLKEEINELKLQK